MTFWDCYHVKNRNGDFGLIRDIIPLLPILFWGGHSSNYGPEMLYFAWLLHPDVVKDQKTRDAILKGGLVRCTTAGSKYKAIDLLLEHINGAYALDIKHNKNSTHDIHATFSRLAVNGNYLAAIRKSVEQVFHSRQKGEHKHHAAKDEITSYACKLYKDGMTKRTERHDPDAFDAPDLFEEGQKVLFKKLNSFNEVTPEPLDIADLRAIPGVAEGGTEDDIVDWGDEAQRLYDLDQNDEDDDDLLGDALDGFGV